MLYLIVLWTVIALASVRLSLLVLPVDVRDRTDGALKADTLFVHIWLGLAMTGGILTALAQVLPLRPEIGLVGLLVLMLDLIRGRIRRSITALIPRLSFKQASLALIPAVLVAFAAAQQVTYFDTAFYHLQLSRLLAEYGAIPGIVALHPNFGQSSLWFAMDRAVGHHRRYSKTALRDAARRAELAPHAITPFNAAGIPGWWWNGVRNKAVAPSAQIGGFDRVVPVLAALERVLPVPVGLSWIAVFAKS